MSDRQISPGAAAPFPDGRARGEGAEPVQGALPVAVLVAVAALVGYDIHTDWDDGATLTHISMELVAVVLAAVSAAWLWWRMESAKRQARALTRDLAEAHADAARLRADVSRFRAESQQHARGLGEAIDRQFERWGLSPAEREVALLLVKGLSHKEAAEVRATSERTVRQQALAVYRKAGLAGRAELAAFFLEDLLQPAPPVPDLARVEGAEPVEAG